MKGNILKYPNRNFTPPPTKVELTVEKIHGTEIPDPYRWLENAHDNEVKNWIQAQNKYARQILDNLPQREKLHLRLSELANIDKVSLPKISDEGIFYRYSFANRDHDIIFIERADGTKTPVIDLYDLSPEGDIKVKGFFPNSNGKYLAYKWYSRSRDTFLLKIRDVSTCLDLEEVITAHSNSTLWWTPDNKGFYYTRILENKSITQNRPVKFIELCYHATGKSIEKDKVLLKIPDDYRISLSNQFNFLILMLHKPTGSTSVFFEKIVCPEIDRIRSQASNPIEAGMSPLVTDKKYTYDIEIHQERFYIRTNEGAPNFHIFSVDPTTPERRHWQEIVKEEESLLEEFIMTRDFMILLYLHNAYAELRIYNLKGDLIKKVSLPEPGHIEGLQGSRLNNSFWFAYGSLIRPSSIYKTSVSEKKIYPWKVNVNVNSGNFILKQIWFKSFDGVRIPMFIAHHKKIAFNGKNPALLTGYGGFKINTIPQFSPGALIWLEYGGVYAFPVLRGGGEFGENWHQSGVREKKQNVFNDFIAAAETLIEQKYTCPEKLGIYGSSNGGLLVGVAMTRRPELFRAVVSVAPLLDMLRYQHFGVGQLWIPEYGCAEVKEEFEWLYAYSPYHNVDTKKHYPALLLLCAEEDPRADPMHARKFAAALQGSKSRNPVLFKIDQNVSHNGSRMAHCLIEQDVDILSFLFEELDFSRN